MQMQAADNSRDNREATDDLKGEVVVVPSAGVVVEVRLCRSAMASSESQMDVEASPLTSVHVNPLEAVAILNEQSDSSPPPSYHDIPGTVPAHRGVTRGPPPSYEQAVDPEGDPPSYDSLFGRIRDTHKASRNLVDFLVKLLVLLLGTLGCTIACSFTVVVPVCMIIVGSVYFDECPAEPYIPVFLIVGGAFSVFKYLIGVMTRIKRGQSESNGSEQARSHPAQSLITCFLCGWFITGCVWVYRIYPPDMDEASRGEPTYCNRTVYVFAFWLITTAYIFLGLFTSCICCISIISVILRRDY